MNITAVCLFGIVAALSALLLKTGKSEYATYVAVATAVILFFYIITGMRNVIETIEEIKTFLKIGDSYIKVLIKIIGICYLTQFSADICKDCGYATLANQVQIFGKVSVLAVSMPILLSLIQMIETL